MDRVNNNGGIYSLPSLTSMLDYSVKQVNRNIRGSKFVDIANRSTIPFLFNIVYRPIDVLANLFSSLKSNEPSIKFLAKISSSLETNLAGTLSFFDLLNFPGNFYKSITEKMWAKAVLEDTSVALLEFGNIQAIFNHYKPDWKSLPAPLSLVSRALQADLSKYLPTVGISLGLFRIWTEYQKIDDLRDTIKSIIDKAGRIDGKDFKSALTITAEATLLAHNILKMTSSSKVSNYTQIGLLTASTVFRIVALAIPPLTQVSEEETPTYPQPTLTRERLQDTPFTQVSKEETPKRDLQNLNLLTRVAAITVATLGVTAATLYLYTPKALFNLTASKSQRLATATLVNLAGVVGAGMLANKLFSYQPNKSSLDD